MLCLPRKWEILAGGGGGGGGRWVLCDIPPVVGVWMFSGTAHCTILHGFDFVGQLFWLPTHDSLGCGKMTSHMKLDVCYK